MVGFVQAVAGEMNFLVQLKYRQNRDMGYCLLTYVCYKEEFGHEVNDPISDLLPPKVDFDC